MWRPKKISGMGCWVTALLFLLFMVSIALFWPLAIFVLVLDAVIYYATLKKNCCAKCKGHDCVIPIDTPMGRKLMHDFSSGAKNASAPAQSNAQQPSSSGAIVYDPVTHQYVKR